MEVASEIQSIEKEKLQELEHTIAQLSLELQENAAVSERLVRSYAALQAHQNDLLKEVFYLIDRIEEDSSDVQRSVDSVKELAMSKFGKHNVMH